MMQKFVVAVILVVFAFPAVAANAVDCGKPSADFLKACMDKAKTDKEMAKCGPDTDVFIKKCQKSASKVKKRI